MFLQNNQKISPLIIVDNNKIQSDTWVKKVKDYSNLKKKIKSFKIDFREINGHDKKIIYKTISKHFEKNNGPTVILANTIKGKGFSLFESNKFKKNMNFYPYHSGKLPQNSYEKATEEILTKIKKFSYLKKIDPPKINSFKLNNKKIQNDKLFSLVQLYSKELLAFVKKK